MACSSPLTRERPGEVRPIWCDAIFLFTGIFALFHLTMEGALELLINDVAANKKTAEIAVFLFAAASFINIRKRISSPDETARKYL